MLRRYEKVQLQNLQQYMTILQKHFTYVCQIVDQISALHQPPDPPSLLKLKEDSDNEIMYDRMLKTHQMVHNSGVIEEELERNEERKKRRGTSEREQKKTYTQLLAGVQSALQAVSISMQGLFERYVSELRNCIRSGYPPPERCYL